MYLLYFHIYSAYIFVSLLTKWISFNWQQQIKVDNFVSDLLVFCYGGSTSKIASRSNFIFTILWWHVSMFQFSKCLCRWLNLFETYSSLFKFFIKLVRKNLLFLSTSKCKQFFFYFVFVKEDWIKYVIYKICRGLLE